MKHVAHWEDVEPRRRETGHLAGTWYDLGSAAESSDVVYYPRTDEIRFRGVGVTMPTGKR